MKEIVRHIRDNPAGAVDILEGMVERDAVIDDSATHTFYRELLDQHREGMAKLNELFA